MKKLLKRFFAKRKTESAKPKEYVSDLLIDDVTLAKAVRGTSRWIVKINASLSAEDTQKVYRNLIRLTSVYRVSKHDILIEITGCDTHAKAMIEQLEREGFNVKTDLIVTASPTKDVLFEEIEIAGLQYGVKPDDPFWETVRVGDEVNLAQEADNEYDANAIAIIYNLQKDRNRSQNIRLGYVPRLQNQHLAALFRGGYKKIFKAYISYFDPKVSYNSRLRVKIVLVPCGDA